MKSGSVIQGHTDHEWANTSTGYTSSLNTGWIGTTTWKLIGENMTGRDLRHDALFFSSRRLQEKQPSLRGTARSKTSANTGENITLSFCGSQRQTEALVSALVKGARDSFTCNFVFPHTFVAAVNDELTSRCHLQGIPLRC